MKKLLPILLLCSNYCFSQTRLEYGNFIQSDTAIKWAAIYNSYINLTPANPNFNIRNFYLKKLQEGSVRSYTEDSLMLSVYPFDLNNNTFLQNTKPILFDDSKMNWQFDYDDKADAFENILKEDSNSCESCITKTKLSFFKVKQLLYYKNNQIRIQNVLLTPVIYKKKWRDERQDIQYFEAANLAFNKANTDSTSIPETAIFITRACNSLAMLPNPQDHVSKSKILTLNNWSLGRLFIKDIQKGKLKTYNAEKNIYPEEKNILSVSKALSYHQEPVKVAIFNELGELIRYKTIMPEVNYDSLYNFLIVQDFYFDFTQEKLYSKLIAVVPQSRIYTAVGIDLGLANHWGVIFPDEKKKLIRPVVKKK